MTAPARERLRSYGGDEILAHVHHPRTLDELREILRSARRDRTRLTFRGGGQALDTQSLNTDVVSLAAFDQICVDPERCTVTVGAGATWGAIVAEVVHHGMVPPVVVTTRSATAAGTVSSDCISRFSPSLGREGSHVLSLRLLTVSGDVLHCSRAQHRDVFLGVIAGLGYLGVIVAVEYRLVKLGHVPAVESRVVPCASFAELIQALAPRTPQPCDGSPADPAALEAISAVCFQRRALIVRSRYRNTSRRKPLRLLHEPERWLRRVFDLVLRVPVLNALGWWLTFRVLFRRAHTYLDDLEGFTFFMDGNVHAKQLGQRFGLAMRVLQQTFVVPTAAAAMFLDEMSAALEQRRLVPTMFDVLFAPADEGFLLSPGNRLSGYAISFAFDTSNATTRARAREFLVQATRRCRAIGGRLSLVKNVCADPGDIAAMYGEQLEAFLALKRRLDPDGVIQNEFFERVLAGAAAASAGERRGAPRTPVREELRDPGHAC